MYCTRRSGSNRGIPQHYQHPFEIGETQVTAMAVTRAQLSEAVLRRLGTPDFLLLDFVEEPASAHFLGFMGTHTRVRATVQLGGQDMELCFFVKHAPQSSFMRAVINDFEAFRKERQFYNDLLHLLESVGGVGNRSKQIEDSLLNPVISESNQEQESEPEPSWAPRCYYATDTVVIMQDLSKLRFQPIGSSWAYEGLSLDTAQVILRALAALHASSLLLERGPRGGPELSPVRVAPLLLHEGLLTTELGTAGRLLLRATAYAVATELVPRVLPLVTLMTRESFLARVHDSVDLLDAQTVRKEFGDVQVVCHGDPWPSNVLLRRDAMDRPLQAVLVDYQFSRWAPPALDVLMCLHIACRRSLRDRELDGLLRGYHAELEHRVNAGGLDLNTVLPLEAFLRSAAELRPVALAIACSYVPVCAAPAASITRVLSDPETRKRFMTGESRCQLFAEWFDTCEEYAERVKEVVSELLDITIVG